MTDESTEYFKAIFGEKLLRPRNICEETMAFFCFEEIGIDYPELTEDDEDFWTYGSTISRVDIQARVCVYSDGIVDDIADFNAKMYPEGSAGWYGW